MGKLSIRGDYTHKKYMLLEKSENVVAIHNDTDNLDYLEFDGVNQRINSPQYPYFHKGVKVAEYNETDDKVHCEKDIYSDTLGVSLGSHATRHNRGSPDPIDYSQISQLFDSGDVSCTVGTDSNAATTTVYSLPSNWYNLIPLAVYMEIGGTVATGETVSISVKAILDDGTELEIASYSVTGTTGNKTETTPFANLLSALRNAGKSGDGRRITQIVADVSSSASSTSATATVRALGIRT